jgi:PPM family protein phosphatase
LRLEFGVLTDQGRVRNSNEDWPIANPRSRVFIVADGMGGHAAGEIASRMTAEKVEEIVTGGKPGSNIGEILKEAVFEANTAVHETQKVRAECRGMGSTLTVLTFSEDQYYIAQVGDSRAYLWRDGTLVQITRDHSLVWESLYEKNLISKDAISRHWQKNLITRSIGTQPQVEADYYAGLVLDGDLFLLCSDGLTDVLSDNDISQILSNGSSADPQKLCSALINAANSGGGPDNVTVAIIRLVPD